MVSHQGVANADLDWNAVLGSQLKHYIPNINNIPEWLLEHRLQQLGALKPVYTPKPKIRGADCNRWIKKQNRQFLTDGGVRKQRKPEAPLPKKLNMARPLSLAQLQRHSIHLMSKVLSLRTNASPFTLIIDDLSQRAAPLKNELMRRALSRNVNIVILSFETTVVSSPAVRMIPAWSLHTSDQILAELSRAMNDYKESLVIVDSLYDLLNVKNVNMAALFELVAVKHCSSLVGVYHQDILPSLHLEAAYVPQPLDIVKYMATTIITCKSLAHVLAAKAAKERSLPEPTHGLLQGAEGIVQCLNANDTRGIVLEAEFRRKSGRPETESYFLRPARTGDYNQPLPGLFIGTLKQEFVVLLDQVPAYANKEVTGLINAAANEMESTFNLSLTDKQKAAREGVVLPYFDAQNHMGDAGEGGRIIYDMGAEDDFDEEEDEV